MVALSSCTLFLSHIAFVLRNPVAHFPSCALLSLAAHFLCCCTFALALHIFHTAHLSCTFCSLSLECLVRPAGNIMLLIAAVASEFPMPEINKSISISFDKVTHGLFFFNYKSKFLYNFSSFNQRPLGEAKFSLPA